MKTIRSILLGAAFLGWFNLAQAQQAIDSTQPDAASQIMIPAMNPNLPVPSIAHAFDDIQINNVSLNLKSVGDVQTMLEAVQSQPPSPFALLPKNRRGQVFGGFWSLQNPYWPPLPGNVWGLDSWPLGNGNFILDDRQVDYDALQVAADAIAAQTTSASPMMRMSMMASSLSSSYAYGNPVYLTNMAASFAYDGSITANFGIGGGTNFVPYDILMSTNLTIPVANWNWIGIGYTSNNYSFYEQPASLGFYILAKPSKTMTAGFGNDVVAQCDVPYALTNALQVVGGGGQSLALKTDRTVVAWGANYYGEGAVPTNLVGVAMIAAGWYHDVALLTNGTVTAWGFNSPALGYYLTNVPPNLTNAIVISAQALHSLALTSNGFVLAWGYDAGAGVTNVPAGLSNVVAIAAGYMHNLAVTTNGNGTVVAWGNNSYGQCTLPPGLSNVVDVAAGTYHSLALLKNGTVRAWGDNAYGESIVPVGLSNVVAIAAAGDPGYAAYSLALKSDGTVVAWGDDDAVDPVGGLNNVISIGAGADHALAVRTGPPTPVITLEPTDEYQVQGNSATFTARGAGLYGVTFQWQTNGVNLSGATSAALTLTNVQPPAQLASYRVIVGNEVGSIVSSNAHFYFVTSPVIVSMTLPTNQVAIFQSNLVLSVVATAPGMNNGFPLSYQWQFNGTNIAGANGASYTIHTTANSFGTYSVLVSNAVGSTNAAWHVTVYNPSGLLITQQPANQYQITGGNVTFAGSGVSSNSVAYQWSFAGTNISGATNAVLTLTNVTAAQQGSYNFTISSAGNSLTSSNAYFYLVTPPTIISQTLPTNITIVFQTNATLNVNASGVGQTNGFPISFQWQFNGTNISGVTSSNYSFFADINSAGTYSVSVSNAAGSNTATWFVALTYVGSYIAPGTLAYYLSTNAVSHVSGYTASFSNMLELANWTSGTYSGANLALLTNSVWSTNCWLHGMNGLSATCIGYSNGYSGQLLVTMVSPRHYLRAHHVGSPGTLIAFLDTNNVIYWRTGLQQVQVGTSDTDVGILDADLPPSVGYLPVIPANSTNFLPTNTYSYVQGIGLHQDLRLFSQPMTFYSTAVEWSGTAAPPFGITTNWDISLFSGDSSNPEMFLIGSQFVLVSHNFFANSGPNYAFQIDGMNQQMHYLSTNNAVGTDYQLSQFSFTNWTVINH